MKKIIVLLIVLSIASICSAQDAMSQATMSYKKQGPKRVLALREGKELRGSSVSVLGFLIGKDVFEVTVDARMKGQRPKIHNVIIVGPKLGRLSYLTRDIVLAGMEETEYEITDVESHISFDNRKEFKAPEGTSRKERVKFKLPLDEFEKGKKYQLKIDIEGTKPGKAIRHKFRFNLDDLLDLIKQ